jgi:hypothetical protein
MHAIERVARPEDQSQSHFAISQLKPQFVLVYSVRSFKCSIFAVDQREGATTKKESRSENLRIALVTLAITSAMSAKEL